MAAANLGLSAGKQGFPAGVWRFGDRTMDAIRCC